MDLIQTILWFLVALIILVAFHEFGHFYVARLCGVKVLRFSIGFGQRIWSTTDRKGTEYCLAAIPLGGYVKMLDEREGDVPESELPFAFNRQSVWKRIAIVAAGPLANFLLAIVLLWGLLLRGESDLVPRIAQVIPNSIATEMGLEVGQEIVAVDGIPTPTRAELARALARRLGESGNLDLTVTYPDSSDNYKLQARLDNWLKDSADPDPLAGLGVELSSPKIKPIVGDILEKSPAEKAGFTEGDTILTANGQVVGDFVDWIRLVQASPGREMLVNVDRSGQVVELRVTPDVVYVSGFHELMQSLGLKDNAQTFGRVGVGFADGALDTSLLRKSEYSIPGALIRACEKTWETSGFLLLSIKKLILGEISTKNLSGPVTIAKVAGSSAKSGLESFIGFLVMISISLAIFNLLPVPVLDGGHLFYYLIEVIRGKPLSDRVQNWGFQIGFVLIISLSLFALYNDLMRL